MNKTDIVRAMEDLPDQATIDDAFDRLLLLHKIEVGLEQAEAGDTIPHEEVEAIVRQWSE